MEDIIHQHINLHQHPGSWVSYKLLPHVSSFKNIKLRIMFHLDHSTRWHNPSRVGQEYLFLESTIVSNNSKQCPLLFHVYLGIIVVTIYDLCIQKHATLFLWCYNFFHQLYQILVYHSLLPYVCIAPEFSAYFLPLLFLFITWINTGL